MNCRKLTLSVVDRPVSPLVGQTVEEKENRTKGICGRRCIGLYGTSYLIGSLLRMYPILLTSVSLTTSAVTWKVLVTPRNRLLYQLRFSGRGTKEKGSGYWPTLTARDYRGMFTAHGFRKRFGGSKPKRGMNLIEYLQSIGEVGVLNPQWAEWYMGYPFSFH